VSLGKQRLSGVGRAIEKSSLRRSTLNGRKRAKLKMKYSIYILMRAPVAHSPWISEDFFLFKASPARMRLRRKPADKPPSASYVL
jgi:hypothetical protein